MLEVNLEKRAEKYLRTLPPKQARQVAIKIFQLQTNPEPQDSKQLTNSMFRRADVGEYRIIYSFTETMLFIPLVGKRNDNEVYRKLKRLKS